MSWREGTSTSTRPVVATVPVDLDERWRRGLYPAEAPSSVHAHLAQGYLAAAAGQLGITRLPTISWFKQDLGTGGRGDLLLLQGFAALRENEIWLARSLSIHDLVETVGHEAWHIANGHDEAAATAFGKQFAAEKRRRNLA